MGKVVSAILQRHFGEIVQTVGYDLFTYGSKPISMIVRSTGLPRNLVVESLRTLLKFDLATFEPYNDLEVIADYKLLPDNVLLLIRYPRYLLQIKSKYGSEAELLVEELLQQATCTATKLLFTIATKYKDDKEKNITIIGLKDMFISLVTAGYIQQAPVAELKEGSEIPTLVPVATIIPDLDSRALLQAMNVGHINDINDTGELMRFLLEKMYLTSAPWAPESSPLCAVEIRERCRSAATDKPQLHQLIYTKKYIEEDDIQKNAMLVNKECKQLTYKLMEEHFISVQPMRKAASAGGMAKAIYLYHVKLHNVAHTGLEMCYRSLHNVLRRAAHERSAHARLVDKQRRVRTIVHGMRLRGETQRNIDDVEETLTPPELAVLQGVEKRLKQLSTAELELDRNLFIFKWYFMYPYTE
ncbi:hypothetical protein HF086_010917 [Spodoptera exigua]|uniref:DNA-directed RNA polymerase III subunit RPC3 n=1 Tax=Spodoptera exigua TaxID=7107 RepID=A0A922MJA8_SPOEX|nr:hypothetical protein HF086_010917 [Spodoptera exigua]